MGREKQQTKIRQDLADIQNENNRARSASRGEKPAAKADVVAPKKAPEKEPIQFAFGQRVHTAAKQPAGATGTNQTSIRPRSRGKDEPLSVSFEPNSILKKESSF